MKKVFAIVLVLCMVFALAARPSLPVPIPEMPEQMPVPNLKLLRILIRSPMR